MLGHMQRDNAGLEVLSRDDSLFLLGSTPVGRVVFTDRALPAVQPVNFVIHDDTIVFRTGEGTKLAAAVIAPQVAIEADHVDSVTTRAWSVVVKGRAERLERFADIYYAEELPLPAWTSHPKQWFVRVQPTEITGRAFTAVTTG